MYKINGGSILSDDMSVLTGVEIQELNLFGFPVGSKTKTDEDGKFNISVASQDSELLISHFGYITVIIKAKDFNVDSLVYLTPAVRVVNPKKHNNYLLYGVVAVSVLTAIYFASRKPVQPRPKPKQLKIA